MERVPETKKAFEYIEQAKRMNPGDWIDHSFWTAKAAAIISSKIKGMNSEKSYVLGLLHDIGRRYGVTQMRHIIDGYNFMMEEGYSYVARISLTHSYPYQNFDAVFGVYDCSEDEKNFIRDFIDNIQFDDYDKLIQLCDSLALPTGFCILEQRFVDVALRYDVNDYTVPKWKAVMAIKEEIEEKIGDSIYKILPDIVENIYR
jgi:hypothetical protein